TRDVIYGRQLVVLLAWSSQILAGGCRCPWFKTNYELATVNHVASRVEDVVEDLYENQHAVVVIGHIPEFDTSKYLAHPNHRNSAQALNSFAFDVYRQVEILDSTFEKTLS